uniref:Uncharacterized protein n=1 Tax=Trichogramma kaykai TaxID=54128 RepID=A0ABD2WUX0_9HYME
MLKIFKSSRGEVNKWDGDWKGGGARDGGSRTTTTQQQLQRQRRRRQHRARRKRKLLLNYTSYVPFPSPSPSPFSSLTFNVAWIDKKTKINLLDPANRDKAPIYNFTAGRRHLRDTSSVFFSLDRCCQGRSLRLDAGACAANDSDTTTRRARRCCSVIIPKNCYRVSRQTSSSSSSSSIQYSIE